ncbi:MAG: response regulator [Promethearchaeota archaeon]|jgi:DNA-binding response OmpR family regulator
MHHTEYDILIIDDSKYINDLLKKILHFKGYSCKSVSNTSDAIIELGKNKPKLILLDVNLPQLSGYEFCTIIKSNKNYKDILVYYFSGVSETEVATKTLETKADGYLKKPFDFADFDDLLGFLKPNSEYQVKETRSI